MRFSVLSSGSKANCTFLEAGNTRILFDCGLSAKETEKRLLQNGIDPSSLNAILVTHEHSDHIYGIRVMSKRYKLPVFANAGTARSLDKPYAIEKFETGEAFWVGSIKFEPFSIAHDAADPVGFAAHSEGLKFVQLTDLGRVTPLVKHMASSAHAMVLESNHDQEMLMNCDYPWHLKQRISSINGHLSNDCAGALLADILHSELNHIVLGHLSENSNKPALALETVKNYVKDRTSPPIIAACVQHTTHLLQVEEIYQQQAV